MEGKEPLDTLPTTPSLEANPWTDVVQGIYQDNSKGVPTSDAQTPSPSADLHEQVPKSVVDENTATNLHNFIESAKVVLERIDKQGNGYVTKQQLAEAVEDPSFKGRQAQALAAMYANFAELHNSGEHQESSESDKISLAGLNKLEQQNTTHLQSLDELEHVQESFGSVSDKSFSLAEIQSQLSDSNTSQQDKNSLRYLQDHFAQIAGSKKVITGDDIASYVGNRIEDLLDTPEEGLQMSARSYMELVNEAQLDGVSRNLYGAGDPLSNIKPEATRQGLIGDCYFEASLASVAVTNPNVIKDSIQDNHNGTFTVTFLGAKNEPITVAAPTDAELGLYNHASKYGTWGSVMEKAYGEFRLMSSNPATSSISPVQGPPQEFADGGAPIGPALSLLTGHECETISYAPESLQNHLENAISGNPPKAVAAQTMVFDKGVTPDGFTANHAFSVTAFNLNANNGGEVDLFDPAGRHIVVPIKTFIKNFPIITVEQ